MDKILYCPGSFSTYNARFLYTQEADEVMFEKNKDIIELSAKYKLPLHIKVHPSDEKGNFAHFTYLARNYNNVKVISGNHDWHCFGLGQFGYPYYNEDPLPDHYCIDNVWLEHGHGIDPIWNNYKRKRRMQRWIGDKLLKIGYVWENDPTKIDPDLILRAGHCLHDKVLPRGWRIDDEKYLDYGCKIALREDVNVVGFGHTHKPGLWRFENVDLTIFNTGAAVPSNKEILVPGTDQIIRPGDIPFFVYRITTGEFFRMFEDDGLVKVN